MGFKARRNFDRLGNVLRPRVRHGNDGHNVPSLDDLAGRHDRTGAILAPLLGTRFVFPRPQIRIANHQAGPRLRQAHGVQSART